MKPLTPYEQWMVKSNLQSIKNGQPKEQIINTLKAGGYSKVAAAVEQLTKEKPHDAS